MPRKQKTIHYLYKTTCLITGRYYVGMHSTSNLDDGYMGSGKRLRYSLRKHGVDNHKKEIIAFFDTRGLLVEAEINAITPEMVTDKNCMNLKNGGTGGLAGLSKEVITRIVSSGGKAFAKRLENDSVFREEHRKRVSSNMTNNLVSKKIIRGDWNGRKHSEESKALMRTRN